MHEIDELEKKWLFYKLKKATLYITGVVGILLIATSTITLYPLIEKFLASTLQQKQNPTNEAKPKQKLQLNNSPETNKTLQQASKREDQNYSSVSQPFSTQNPLDNQTKQSDLSPGGPQTVTLAPSLTFIQNAIQKLQAEPSKTPFSEEMIDISPDLADQKNSQTAASPLQREVTTMPSSKIEIKKSEADGLKYIKERFNKTKDPKLAIFLAKSYFNEGNYTSALNWAIITNELESDNEESWILFAQSSVKLGNKLAAINALEAYLSKYDSNRIRLLLEQIKNGEYR